MVYRTQLGQVGVPDLAITEGIKLRDRFELGRQGTNRGGLKRSKHGGQALELKVQDSGTKHNSIQGMSLIKAGEHSGHILDAVSWGGIIINDFVTIEEIIVAVAAGKTKRIDHVPFPGLPVGPEQAELAVADGQVLPKSSGRNRAVKPRFAPRPPA